MQDNNQSVTPNDPPESASVLSEWDEALQLVATSISPHPLVERENTQLSVMRQCTGLPIEIAKIIGEYAASQVDLRRLVQEGTIRRENFWRSVVGFFPIYECFPFEMRDAPPLSLVSDKIRKGGAGLAYLETWAIAILLDMARQTQKALSREDCKGDEYEDEYGYEERSRKGSFFALQDSNGLGDNSEKVNDPYLASLENILHSAPALTESMLADENVLCVVQYYPRLQSVFLSALFANAQPISPAREKHIAQWMPDNERPHHTLSPFQLLRVINRALLNSWMSLETLKTVTPIQRFLMSRGLEYIEDTRLFFTAVCLRAHEFLNPSLFPIQRQETNREVDDIVQCTKTSSHFDIKFKDYCLQGECVPDWYVIFQYVLIGAKVDGVVLGHLTSIGHIQGIQLLLQIPEVNVNSYPSKRHEGDTCLMMAVTKGHTRIVEMFLRHPDIYVNQPCIATPDANDNCHEYYTALTLAVNYKRLEIARLLVAMPEINAAHHYSFVAMGSVYRGALVSLAYKDKFYVMISLLFQALNIGSVSDEIMEELLRECKGDLRLLAASIASNPQRFGSIAFAIYREKPEIVRFLSQTSGLNGDYALKKLVSKSTSSYPSAYYPHTPSDNQLVIAQRLLTDTIITTQGLHGVLFTLLVQGVNKQSWGNKDEVGSTETLALLTLLCSQPGIDIYHEDLLMLDSQEYCSYSGSNNRLAYGEFVRVQPERISLLGLAAKKFEYLHCMLEHSQLDLKDVQADPALVSAILHTYSSPQEKLKVIRYLLNFTRLTTNTVQTALFLILHKGWDMRAETLEILDILFSQPGIDIYAEDKAEEQKTESVSHLFNQSNKKKIEQASIFNLAIKYPASLWCMAQRQGLDTGAINGDQALKAAVGDFLRGSVDHSETFHTVQRLLSHTQTTPEGIHEVLFMLLRYSSNLLEVDNPIKIQLLKLLLAQPGVDIYREDTFQERYVGHTMHDDGGEESKETIKRNTLLDLMSKEASYLACIAECAEVDLGSINGDQALKNAVSSRAYY